MDFEVGTQCGADFALSAAGLLNSSYFAPMPVRSCRVTIQDMDGVSHTVEVTAATLYEAVAQGLNVVRASVADIRVEHEVRLMDFTKWLDRTGGSPREVSDRHKIRSILGIAVSR
jgi:hypothetical protein